MTPPESSLALVATRGDAEQTSNPIPVQPCSPTYAPLKIALLGYRSHPFVGGQGIYLKYLSSALAALGHQVDVYSGPPYPELEQTVRLIKVPSLDLFEQENHVTALRPKHLRSYTDTIEWFSMLCGGFAEPYTFGRRIQKLLKSNDYDIVHDNQSLSHGLVNLQKSGTRVVSTIHHPIHRDREIALAAANNWQDRLLIKRWYSFLGMQNKVVRKLQHVVTVSEQSQSDIERYFHRDASKTQVIPNGIDTELFRPLNDIARVPFRVITTASSDQPLKGLSYLLKAIAQLKSSYPSIHLQVIGKLKEDSEAATLLSELDLNDYVSFASGISTEELVQHYAQASVMVCPSLYEGFGLPLGEAMACTLPTITTDGGALPEVAGDASLIIKRGDANAIASKLVTLFENPHFAEELGKKARQRIENKFSWQTVARELTQYYHSIK
ncbi:MAG: glycosyltransferase family 4 protein [Agarilytica sp.]